MSKKLLLGAIVAIVPILGIAGYAAAGGGQSSLADLRQATAQYHDVATAVAERSAVELPQVAAGGGGSGLAAGVGMGEEAAGPKLAPLLTG